jgi:hypothetical protein
MDVAQAVDPFACVALPAPRPLALAVAHLPSLTVDGEAERRIRLGQQAVLEALAPALGLAGGATLLVRGDGTLVAIAERAGDRWALARVFAAPAYSEPSGGIGAP